MANLEGAPKQLKTQSQVRNFQRAASKLCLLRLAFAGHALRLPELASRFELVWEYCVLLLATRRLPLLRQPEFRRLLVAEHCRNAALNV